MLDGELAYRLDEAAYDWLKTNGWFAQKGLAEEGIVFPIAGRDTQGRNFARATSRGWIMFPFRPRSSFSSQASARHPAEM